MSAFIAFVIALLTNAILNGASLLFGTMGEILTEKSGNLNLGVEGMMFMGGACGLAGVYYYSNGVENPNGYVCVIIALLCAFFAGVIGSLIYSFLTISLRANQNVTGLALTIFGQGIGQFIGEYMRVKAGGYVTINNDVKVFFQASPFPDFLKNIPIIGQLLFGYNFFVYFGLLLAILMTLFIRKTKWGLNLRAVGESPATADAAGINITRYKYFATVIGGGLSAVGGMVFIMTVSDGVWNHEILKGQGWLAVALVIFCLWKPFNSIWGSAVFGALTILYLRWHLPIPDELYKLLPYVVTIIVLIFTSMRKKREHQPPASLGNAYFREDR